MLEGGEERETILKNPLSEQETKELWESIREIPARISKKRPLVHMIPNSVTVTLCTDGLSALGARPLMAAAPEEMEEIPAHADALVVNMGQPTKEKLEAARLALGTAADAGVPIVWDPVGAGASGFRRREFSALLELRWKGIVKGNRGEIAALQTGELSHQGIDSIGKFDLHTRAEDGRVWAVSGPQDLVFDEKGCFALDHKGGEKLMLTGSGCLTGAVMGACAAVEESPVTAALAAFLIMSYAGEKAAVCAGYGSQKAALLDALTAIDPAEFSRYAETALANLKLL